MTRRDLSSAALAAVLVGAAGAGRADSIVTTPHNLSVSGPGPVKATSETQVCVFCHTPHDANPAGPLWNHQLSSGVTYLKYTSPTLIAYTSQASAPDPNGASKLCLSCHDGSVALGAVTSQASAIPLQGGKTQLVPGDPGYLGTDLSKTHPISFIVTDQLVATNNSVNAAGLALNSTAAMRSDPDVHLDALDRVQCTSCHDPHSDANFGTSGVHFYKKPQRSEPCLVCHTTALADLGPHIVASTAPLAVSAAPLAASPPPPAASAPAATGGGALARSAAPLEAVAPANVATPGAGGQRLAHGNAATLPFGCMSCHVSHTSEEGRRALLLGRDEDACYRCHGPGSEGERREGRLAVGTRPADLVIEFQKPSHHPIERPGDHRPNERLPETNPNVRRHVLCVDCHDAHGTLPRQPPAGGLRTKPSSTRRFSTEAQQCLLCHGPAANRPAGQPDVSHQLASISYHPVLAPGRGVRGPSLVPPLTTTSVISCSDCHGNDDPTGPQGPHGSVFAPLLVRSYQRDDLQPESPARYDLCYRCHDRNSILSDASFPFHRKHVVEQRTPCAACHAAHGADAPGLVAFDGTIVQPNAKGLRAFTPLGNSGGQCSLACHGANHDPASYCGPGLACPQALRSSGAARPPPPASTVPAPESLFPAWPGQ